MIGQGCAQSCPALKNEPPRMVSTTASMSASSNAIAGAFPPRSRRTGRICREAPPIAALPVAGEPVMKIASIAGWLIRRSPTVGPRPCMTLTTPGRR